MLQLCTAPGCSTRTIGPLCMAHEPQLPPREYPRGRPYGLKGREAFAPVPVLTGKTSGLDVVLLEGAT